MSQLLDADPVVVAEGLGFIPPCLYWECQSSAQWTITWTCDCSFPYCTEHKGYVLKQAAEGNVFCGRQRYVPITPREVVKL